MNFENIQVRLVPSTNHASPSGALPFLVSYEGGCAAVPNGRLKEWVRRGSGGGGGGRGGGGEESGGESAKVKAFEALIEGQIRDAWVYYTNFFPMHFFFFAEGKGGGCC